MEPDINLSGASCDRRRLLLAFYSTIDGVGTLARHLQHTGWELILCPLSLAGETSLHEVHPDLVLVDDPDGDAEIVTTCTALRSRTELPIVLLSAKTDELFVAQVLGLGIDECLPQPIGSRELTARLEALFRRLLRYQGTREGIRAGDLTLSFIDHTVERGGRKVNLSPIEFRLLSCLVAAPGSVLTHQTLMARVWGSEYVDSRHYLRLYIRYLREKLEDDLTAPKLILSEWGIGYRFQPQDGALTSSSQTNGALPTSHRQTNGALAGSRSPSGLR